MILEELQNLYVKLKSRCGTPGEPNAHYFQDISFELTYLPTTMEEQMIKSFVGETLLFVAQEV